MHLLHGRERFAAVAGAFAAHGLAELAMLHVMFSAFAGANLAGSNARFYLSPQHLDILRGAPNH